MKTLTLVEELAKKIQRGEYTDKFPSYRQLVREYHCSFRTVSKAIDSLKAKGLVDTFNGNGTYVKKRS